MSVKYAVLVSSFEFNPSKCNNNVDKAFTMFDGDSNGKLIAVYDTIDEARAHLSGINVRTYKYSWKLARAEVAYIEEAEYVYDEDCHEWQMIDGCSYWDLKFEELEGDSDDD